LHLGLNKKVTIAAADCHLLAHLRDGIAAHGTVTHNFPLL
jgi:hypothetical protein